MTEKMGGGVGRVEVIAAKGCSRLFMNFSSSFRGIPSFLLEPLSSSTSGVSVKTVKPDGPFSGLVICVTGLSKETRKQVKEATETLGGQYSPDLHPQCTHLVVQSFHGRKFQHALKHGLTNGLLMVTIGWFVDSVKKNVRLSETLYMVNRIDEDMLNGGSKRFDQNSSAEKSSRLDQPKQLDMIETGIEAKGESILSALSGQSFYIDADVSAELHRKVAEVLYAEGAILLTQWFVGCNVAYVVCEGPSAHKYMGHARNLVTPLWVLKSAKERSVQRLIHLSVDLATYAGGMLDVLHNSESKAEINISNISGNIVSSIIQASQEERGVKVNLAKDGVRRRRDNQMLTNRTPTPPTTPPSSLLDSICWTISEPTSTASTYTEFSSVGNAPEDHSSIFFDAKEDRKESSDRSLVNSTRPLTQIEKCELILRSHFITIMFPVDRFSDMGPACSRTFFSSEGFTRLQLLDYVYEFYQENMSGEEIEVAIHTDSKHADRLRSTYSGCQYGGQVEVKRIDFLGSRRRFEKLKRISTENSSSSVYELLIRA